MNVEEARDILANVIADEIIGTYCLNEAQKYNCDYCENDDCIYNKAIETVLNELDKKDKIIDMMAEYIEEWTGSCPNDMYDWQDIDCEKECEISMKKCWIEYFYNKAQENNN